MMTISEYYDLTVCTDCLHVICNGVESDEHERAANGMAQLWKGYRLSPGKGYDDCDHRWPSDAEKHSYWCEDFGFSNATCQGCGDPLAGDRHAATAWPNRS